MRKLKRHLILSIELLLLFLCGLLGNIGVVEHGLDGHCLVVGGAAHSTHDAKVSPSDDLRRIGIKIGELCHPQRARIEGQVHRQPILEHYRKRRLVADCH